MNEKPIPQALREQADALFAIQSKLRYEYFWIAEAMWDV